MRNSLHQFADFRFQILVRHDQRLERVAHVATARRNRFVRCRFKPVGVGLWIWRGALRHGQFPNFWTTRMFPFCSREVKRPETPASAAAVARRTAAKGLVS
jgi:hypothetical protein